MRRMIWVARGSGARRTREKRENCYSGKNVNKRERGRSCCCTREREREKQGESYNLCCMGEERNNQDRLQTGPLSQPSRTAVVGVLFPLVKSSRPPGSALLCSFLPTIVLSLFLLCSCSAPPPSPLFYTSIHYSTWILWLGCLISSCACLVLLN